MITRVQVKNYRSLADVDVTLGPLTVLVGANGAGKSSFVDVLRFVRDAMVHGVDKALSDRGGLRAIQRSSRNQSDDVTICVTAEEKEHWIEYAFSLGSDESAEYCVKRESWKIGKAAHAPEYHVVFENGELIEALGEPLLSELKYKPLNKSLAMPILHWTSNSYEFLYLSLTNNLFYTLLPSSVRGFQMLENTKILKEDGSNFASVLKRMQDTGNWFTDLLASLRCIVQDISDLRVQALDSYLIVEINHKWATDSSAWFNLSQESDGTVRILAILVALYERVLPNLVSIEEPEIMLHPGALGVLSDILRETSRQKQILITTQSPDLISRFGADELRIVEREDGITRIGPIDETQREVLNAKLFLPGDLLRIEGLHRSTLVAGTTSGG